MSEFTYIIPDQDAFFAGLISKLSRDGHIKLVSLLRKGSCGIVTSQQFSRRRWNAFWTEIEMRLPTTIFESDDMDFIERNKEIIKKAADEIMPGNAGFDVMDVKLLPLLEFVDGRPDLDIDVELKNAIDHATSEIQRLMIPDNILEDAKTMSEVYIHTYCAENSIRNLIINIAKDNYGENYFDNLQLTRGMETKIERRKRDAEKWKWIADRGDVDIYYLNFEDLAGLIRQNWGLFEYLFPSQEWICVKITELSKVRNPIAHHGLIGRDEKLLVEITYRQILAQVQSVLR